MYFKYIQQMLTRIVVYNIYIETSLLFKVENYNMDKKLPLFLSFSMLWNVISSSFGSLVYFPVWCVDNEVILHATDQFPWRSFRDTKI